MAKILGEKSRFLIRMDYMYRIGFVLTYIILIYTVYKIIINFINKPLTFLGLAVATVLYTPLIIWIDKLLKKYSSDALNFKVGRFGEYAVCRELEKLSDDYFVFQDLKMVSMGRANIDFVILGPTGIFYVEVKSHSGYIYFNKGKRQLERRWKIFENNFINKTINGACKLKEYLDERTKINPLYVNAVLVFSNPKSRLNFKSDIVQNLNIIKIDFINQFIDSNKRKLSNENISIIKNELEKLVCSNRLAN